MNRQNKILTAISQYETELYNQLILIDFKLLDLSNNINKREKELKLECPNSTLTDELLNAFTAEERYMYDSVVTERNILQEEYDKYRKTFATFIKAK